MGIREDQTWGMSEAAGVFLNENEIPPEVCSHCQRPFPRPEPVIGNYTGMFDTEYSLHRYTLRDGRTADEFVQQTEWSSGPCIFLGLQVSDGTEYLWTAKEIEERI